MASSGVMTTRAANAAAFLSSSSSLVTHVLSAECLPTRAALNKSYTKLSISAAAARLESPAEVRNFVLRDFVARRAFKVISGLQNFDAKNVTSVVIAAQKGGATHVDIACSPDLVKLALQLASLPVCVSSVEPEFFLPAVEAGAHMVEIGNYDSFYAKNNRFFSAEEVLDLARQTRRLLPSTVLSVTVPHTLSLDEQVKLAEMLEGEGVDIIQTEGGTSTSPSKPGVHGLMEKAAPTLAAAYSISKAVQIPVMCASGLSDVTAPLALAAGAAGVGVGSAINKLDNEVAMIASVRSIANALGLAAQVSAQHAGPIGSSRVSMSPKVCRNGFATLLDWL
ncbi:hypothetical protein GOP47_0019455 [Adiantum capillus-veneris]|uniref:Uncharacterized protein ycf23 n=1 Tax=Adiantum capillus-veneris TaxID=13818 RepID=A0A9D4UBC2_ADICA|nr:hypothetical protein GOP47_0019455 [Adiantum capillus-veneris]